MGNAGKFVERARARELRAQSWTLQAIANDLGVAKSSVSLWCRDIIDFTPNPRNRGHSSMKPHPMRVKRLAEVDRCQREAVALIGMLTEREFLMYGLGLYHGEGSKTDGVVKVTNTSPQILLASVAWLRRFFTIDESRLRLRLYLHEGLDLGVATEYWSTTLGIPMTQFHKPYRAEPRSIGGSKHLMGCATVVYACSRTHRSVMAMIEAISSSFAGPG